MNIIKRFRKKTLKNNNVDFFIVTWRTIREGTWGPFWTDKYMVFASNEEADAFANRLHAAVKLLESDAGDNWEIKVKKQ